ncbi:MAG TPA: hypothetical protein VK644_00360, partial [Chitinophagaceae bacterium]|nr:hypothetical protein [Chitinophagaceae bacterium]
PAGAGPTSWSVRSSLDGYTANISSGSMTLNYANYTVSPGVAFATLPTAVTFRVYGYNATTSTGGSSRMVFDYVEVTGLGAILPIHLTSFTVRARSRSVALTYTVTNAEQGTRYMIERSVNGTDFAVIHSGTETGRQEDVSYDYEDQLLPPGISRLYYRLHIVEAGGHSFYSSVVSVSPDIGKSGVIASIKNNVLTISGSLSANSNLILFSNTGTVILQQQLNNMAGPQSRTIMIPFLARGVYYVSLISAVGKQSVAVMAP